MTTRQLYVLAFLSCAAALGNAEASVNIKNLYNFSAPVIFESNLEGNEQIMKPQLIRLASMMNEGEWY